MSDAANSRFEAMTTGVLLDRSIRLSSDNFLPLLAISCIAHLPVYLVQYLIKPSMVLGSVTEPSALEALLEFAVGIALYTTFTFPVAYGASTYIISKRYLGVAVTVGEASSMTATKLRHLTLAAVIANSITTAGFLLLIVPGFLCLASYYLIAPVIIIENLAPVPSLRRSWELVRDGRKKVLAVFAVMICLSLVLVYGAGLIIELFVPALPEESNVVSTLSGHLISVLVTPFAAVCEVLLYYDFRIRKEGFDLEMLNQALAKAKSTVSTPAMTTAAGR